MSTDQQSLSAGSIDFSTALDRIRAGVETRSEENARIHELLDVATDRDIDTDPFGHPKITQSLFRYDHDAETVRGEIRRAIETYGFEADPADVVAVITETASQLSDASAGGMEGDE